MKKIVHVFKSNESMGLGDFIRGSLALTQISDSELELDFSDGALGHFIDTPTYEEKKPLGVFLNTPTWQIIDFLDANKHLDTIFVSTNSFPLRTLSRENIQKFLHAFKYRENFRRRIFHLTEALPKDYVAVHIRLGDQADKSFLPHEDVISSEGNQGPNFFLECEAVIHKNLVKNGHLSCSIIVTDNIHFKNYMARLGYRVTEGTPVHSGWVNNQELLRDDQKRQIENTLIEFNILCHARKIYQYSTYWWGSGFSDMACLLYRIPKTNILPLKVKLSNRYKLVRTVVKSRTLNKMFKNHQRNLKKNAFKYLVNQIFLIGYIKLVTFIRFVTFWIPVF